MRAVDRKRKNIFLTLHARNTEISVSWVFAERPELRQDLHKAADSPPSWSCG